MVLAAALAAALLAAPRPAPAQGMQVSRGDDSSETRAAAGELAALTRRIERGEIAPVEFDTGKADLKPGAEGTLRLVAAVLLRHPELHLTVNGHTDDVGSPEYNMWLSQNRAETVKRYLISQGVLGESIRALGFGETKPIAPNDCEEHRAKNRRVEFVLSRKAWGSVF
ncbi:MAG: OmpA family protein [Elusimicrobia bacterium]|nr:OmpA family protein [Elusimicrobiota bacterium]